MPDSNHACTGGRMGTVPRCPAAFGRQWWPALYNLTVVFMASRQAVNSATNKNKIRSTTVVCVRRGSSVVMSADGQVTLGEGVIKHTARKIRRLYNDKILAGFAGSTADAFSLFGRFESKLEQYHGNLGRAAVELAKEWRTDKMLRHLEALLLVAAPP